MKNLLRSITPALIAVFIAMLIIPTVSAANVARPSTTISESYPNGTLILDGTNVYTIYRGEKIAFSTTTVFINLGYKWTNLYGASIDYLPNTGATVNSSNEHHPWGSWVIGGKTVYFVHKNGLIPITTWDIFLSNGGESKLIVPMNWYDWQLPQLSFLRYEDERLASEYVSYQTIRISRGDSFNIVLDANPSTGYNWDVSYNISYLNLISRDFEPYSNAIGSDGVEKFKFEALKRGETTIEFDYHKVWEATVLHHEVYYIIIE